MQIDLPVLRSEQISLEPFRPGDEEALMEGAADPLVKQFALLGWRDPLREDFTRFITEDWPALRTAGRAAVSSIRDAASDAVLGYLVLFDVQPTQRRAEVGYWLLPSGRGRGAATEAVRLVVDWALGDFGLHRVQAAADVENVASQRVLERAGFEREAILRSFSVRGDGTRADNMLFSRISAEPRHELGT